MRNPNFLVLDEPTNDLDIKTLQILEEYLQDFPGCVIVVSHDRYFMDKVVDHILVFHGEGDVKDFPGNYTQYREWSKLNSQKDSQEAKGASGNKTTADSNKAAATGSNNSSNDNSANGNSVSPVKRKMTYKEKREFEMLEKDIVALSSEKASIEEELSSGMASVERITLLSKRLPQLNDELDEKEMRWLELSELQ
jgi:ATP-binding cassette subfamily F protein uup